MFPFYTLYYIVLHKDQLSKVSLNGRFGRYRVNKGVKSTLFCCLVTTKVKKLKKKHSINKNPTVNKSYFGFKVLNPEN